MGSTVNKVFLELDGIPIIIHNLKQLSQITTISEAIIVIKREEVTMAKELLESYSEKYFPDLQWKVVAGGEERQDSVINALTLVEDEFVAVHDAVRPFAGPEIFKRVYEAAKITGAAVAGVALKDTIKIVDSTQQVVSTPERSNLRAIQTPQIFKTDLLKSAYAFVKEKGINVTDDAGAVELLGGVVSVAEGDFLNNKITTPEDLMWASQFVQKNKKTKITSAEETVTRIGMGYDVHRFDKDRKLVLCGVEIPYEFGLAGHSDADVVLHAVMDALLGAVGAGDIGVLFPDTDAAYKDANSLELLREVKQLVESKGWILGNMDITIIAEEPKILPYREQMIKCLSEVLERPKCALNIKATTNEGLGFLGRKEGIVAQAIALLVRKS
ncbi:MAG TPA: 2-C-methyl-D-erythritol 2,4-cyclodiphosphate synthase [Candidatus Avacidaminococcus intestinavium]|uniref:Bifunctional enzyme IspD/IspF n=1 Tax=Candidatus Avacidaminococcus intestinavium TaxID=2840684 RepID=A0A9D1MP45_9FIRM|nr:2-C-methyl-D-erythritol 2,4-cyclodiphosphate synthase [Candidatus Avacidaminococcus intestinavium]